MEPVRRDDAERPAIDFRWAPSSVWTLICLPDDPHKTLVREDGALLYDFTAAAFDEWRFAHVLEFGAQTTHTPLSVRQWTEGPRRPIVHTVLDYPRQAVELTAFSTVQSGKRLDVVLWDVTAKHGSGETYTGLRIDGFLHGAALASLDAEGPYHVVHPVPAEPWPRTRRWVDDLPYFDVEAHPWYEPPWSLRSVGHELLARSANGFRPASGLLTRPVQLLPGETVSGALVVTLGGEDIGEVDLDWAVTVLDERRRYWDVLPLGDETIGVPEREVQDLLTASARNLLQAREVEDGLPVLHVGPTIYRGLYLVDAHFMLEAARYLGFDDAADAGLEILLRRVKPDGSITETRDVPHLKETAIGITTLVRQAELTGDIEMLRKHWPTVQSALGFIRDLRGRAKMLPSHHPFFGLMPEGFGDGGIGGVRAEYTTVAWTLIGLKYALRGASMLNDETSERMLTEEFTDLLAAFGRSLEQHRRNTAELNTPYLPIAPGSGDHQFTVGMSDDEVPRWRRVQPETATWALAQAVWPGEVFPADDPVVRDLLQLFDERDDQEGIPATTGWLPWEAVWTYAASFAAHAWLYAERPDKTIEYLYAFANHASPTRVWREEQPLAGTGNPHICGDMPHNWASAEFIRLVRHALVFERGDTLDLFSAMPDHWWQSGQQVRVTDTPTRFGSISVLLSVAEDVGAISIARHATESYPAQVTARVYLPAGARLEGASIPVQYASGNDVELVLERTSRVDLRVRR